MESLIFSRTDEFRVDFTVQREWRLLILIAFFAGGVGAGTFMLSQLMGHAHGMVAGLFIVGVIKTGAHLLYLGRPLRFLRAFSHPQTSWISRGMIGLAVFLLSGILYVAPFFHWFNWLPWTPSSPLGQAIGAIAFASALWVTVYTAFVMATPPSIAFWNTALLPVLFLVYGVMGGMDVLLVLLNLSPVSSQNHARLELIEIGLILLALAIVLVYVGLMGTGSAAAKRAAQLMTKGPLAPHFLGGVVAIGLVAPLALGLYVYFVRPSDFWLTAVEGVLVLVGGLTLRWVVLRAGVYAPVY